MGVFQSCCNHKTAPIEQFSIVPRMSSVTAAFARSKSRVLPLSTSTYSSGVEKVVTATFRPTSACGSPSSSRSKLLRRTAHRDSCDSKAHQELVKNTSPWMRPFSEERETEQFELIVPIVRHSWELVLKGETPAFRAEILRQQTIERELRDHIHETPIEVGSAQTLLSPLVHFFDCFYEALWDLMPDNKERFHARMSSQTRMFAHIIAFALAPESLLVGQLQFESTLRYLAVMHNRMGIREWEYNILGLCLLTTLRKVLGGELYTGEVKAGWTLLYRRMMSPFLPEVIAGTLVTDDIPLEHVKPELFRGPFQDTPPATGPE